MKMKQVGWTVVSALLVSAVILYASMRFEITESYYDTYEEIAAVPNIFDAGWIPKWLPKTAKQIKESHDIDTNETWITFNFSSSDKFYIECQSVKKSEMELPVEKQVDRFPSFVAEAISSIKNDSLTFYHCNNDSSRYLAIDNRSMHAYIWNQQSP